MKEATHIHSAEVPPRRDEGLVSKALTVLLDQNTAILTTKSLRLRLMTSLKALVPLRSSTPNRALFSTPKVGDQVSCYLAHTQTPCEPRSFDEGPLFRQRDNVHTTCAGSGLRISRSRRVSVLLRLANEENWKEVVKAGSIVLMCPSAVSTTMSVAATERDASTADVAVDTDKARPDAFKTETLMAWAAVHKTRSNEEG